MRTTIWNVIYLAGFVVYVAIRGVFGARTKRNVKTVSRADVWDRALLIPVFLGTIALPLLYLFTPWLAFADYRLPLFLQCCGVITMIVALWLFWRAHADLGLNWSVTLEMRKEHELIMHGVYRRIRHPMYTAIFLFSVAQGCLLENWLAGWGAFVTFGLLYLIRVPREEKMMGEFFGQSYRDYAERTGRLWPRVREGKRKNSEVRSGEPETGDPPVANSRITPPEESIFMCYRRLDSEEVVDRIYESFEATFPREAIFRDIDTVPPGVDFRDFIQDALRRCHLVLVFIGRDWLGASDDQGARRLDDPSDHVRIEIETALRAGVRITPVLVRRASMPKEAELPSSLASLAFRSGITVRTGADYHGDVARLVGHVQSALAEREAEREAKRTAERAGGFGRGGK